MHLCKTCGALMWGENCTNIKCDEHYTAERRAMANMLKAANAEGSNEPPAPQPPESTVNQLIFKTLAVMTGQLSTN